MFRHHRRLAALAAAIGLAAIFLPVFAGIVMGHHADIKGTLACNGTVSWELRSWSPHEPEGTNKYMHVQYSLNSGSTWSADVWSGTITGANYTTPITGTFSAGSSTTVKLKAFATGNWANGNSSRGPWYWNVVAPHDCDSSTATEIHGANHTVVTSVPVGTQVHDKATVTGSAGVVPTGTVTFKWYLNGTCSGSAASTSSALSLSGGSVDATGFAKTPSPPGSYSFKAFYSGSSRYHSSTGDCEPLTVTKIDSSTVTEIHGANHTVVTSVPVGTQVHDKATVSGSGPTPTGTVTFSWFANAACTGDAAATSGALVLGSGSVDATGFAQVPTPAGGYAFQATYSGDGYYNGSTGDCEPLTVTKLDSATVTTIRDATGAPVTSALIGSTVYDFATVSAASGSGPTPTGDVSFTYYPNTTCSPEGTSAGTKSLDASGTAGPSDPQTVGVSGGSFKATYDGDGIYNGSTGDCEPLQPIKLESSTVTDIHDATESIVTTVPAGTTVHDSATVTGSGPIPTGTVTFRWYTQVACDSQYVESGPFSLDAAGKADGTTFTQTPIAAGGYGFRAVYSGDDVYLGSVGACEPLEVTKIDSATATAIHDADHNVITSALIGSTIHDSATVSGSGPTPTGTVSFTVYPNQICDGNGTAAGTVALVGGVADPSDTAIVGPAGLSYSTHYSGDQTYHPSDGACEPLVPIKLDSNTATEIHDANHTVVTSVPAGTSVHDRATVTGSLGDPTGSVTFAWFTNATCSGDPAAISSAFSLVGGSVDATSFSQAPVAAGGYAFQATYGGDDTYKPSVGACEPLEVTKLDSRTSTEIHDASHAVVTTVPAGTPVHDSALVAGSGPVPGGSVTFYWFTNAACTGDPVADSGPLALSGGSVDATGFVQAPLAAGGYAFQAVYSGNVTYDGSTGACEPLEVTKLDSSTKTDIHDANHQVITSAPIGSTVHDSATVTGSGPVPTGTVSFTVFPAMTCVGVAGAPAGTVALVNGVADPSDSQIVAVGGLAFQTHYNGDATYAASTGPCELLEATKLQSSTVTAIHDADHQVITSAPIGSTVHDSATVSGSGPVPTGTVDFTVYDNTTCSSEGASAGSVALAGGVADPSSDAVVGVNGLSFSSHYSGDDTYAPSDGACEPLTATKLDSATATEIHNASHAVVTDVLIGTPVHDTATVTGSGPVPTGSVTFAWFTNAACDGQPAATSGAFALAGGSVDATGFVQVPAVSGGYAFQATYGGDDTYAGSTGPCEPLTAHEPIPTPTPTASPTTTPSFPRESFPTEPPFPSFTPTPPAPTATPTEAPTPTLAPTPTQSPTPQGSVAGVTSAPHVTPPPTNTAGGGDSGGNVGLAAALALLVAAAGTLLLVTPRRRVTRR